MRLRGKETLIWLFFKSSWANFSMSVSKYYMKQDFDRFMSLFFHRFTSSAAEQWKRIEESYAALCIAYNTIRPNRSDVEEDQYKLMGQVGITFY